MSLAVAQLRTEKNIQAATCLRATNAHSAFKQVTRRFPTTHRNEYPSSNVHPRHERSQRVQTGHSPFPNYAQKRISKQQRASAPRTLSASKQVTRRCPTTHRNEYPSSNVHPRHETLTARPNSLLAVAHLPAETNIQAATCIRATNAHSASKQVTRRCPTTHRKEYPSSNVHPRHECSQRVQRAYSPLPIYPQKRISKQQRASAPRTLTARPNRSLAIAQLRTETNIQAATCIRATNAHSASKQVTRRCPTTHRNEYPSSNEHPRHKRSHCVQTGPSPLPNHAQKRISKQQRASAPGTLTARPNVPAAPRLPRPRHSGDQRHLADTWDWALY
ncbi:hypothetical protein MRX96_050260 [Rhipicephalus microplus]